MKKLDLMTDAQLDTIAGGLTVSIDPYGGDGQAAADANIVDAKGATLALFGFVLSHIDPMTEMGDGSNIPGLTILPVL